MSAAVAASLAMGLLGPVAAAPPSGAADAAPVAVDLSKKVDSHLLDLIEADMRGADVESYARERGLTVKPGKRVLADVYFNGGSESAQGAVRGAGMDVVASNDRAPFKIKEGWLPLNAIKNLARNPTITTITGVLPGGTNAGSITSEGDAAHNGPAARALGVDGAGVNVGVISDSIDQVGAGVAGSQASGDLPATVNVLADLEGGTDEGRAMAEIIYDTAPGVTTMNFATASSGAVGKAANINALASAGVDVIADDSYFLTEPMFQDGVVAQAVDYVVSRGTAYFASAGNRARQSYEATFNSSRGLHDFDPSGGDDSLQTVATVPNGKYIFLYLQWAEPWGNATTDLDTALFTVSEEGSDLLTYDATNNLGGNPISTLYWKNTFGAPVSVGLRIERAGGSASPFMKYIAGGNFGAFTVAEHATNSPAIDPGAASATNSMAVAAVSHADPGHNDPESFSSRGPSVTRRFDINGNPRLDIRQKPQVAGADAVNTTVPGFAPFFGTSAATPSVAGIAALAISAPTSPTASQVYAALSNPANTIDCTLAGNPDADCGYGFVLAEKVIAQVQTIVPGNDNRATRDDLYGLSGTFAGTNVNATAEAGEPATRTTTPSDGPNATVWYRWTAAATGPAVFDTCATTSFDSMIAVYDSLTRLGESDDACGGQGRVVFDATEGSNYWIQVDGAGSSTGQFELRWSQPPENDAFADAQRPSGLSGTIAGTTAYATAESGEPATCAVSCTNGPNATVWYFWTAPMTGTATFDTCANTTFDSMLAAYAGSGVNALTRQADNDNACGQQSRISFAATSGMTYRIQVDGFGQNRGAFELGWSLVPSNDDFADAVVLSGGSGTVAGDNTGATAESGEPATRTVPSTNGPNGTVWYSWTAPMTGTATFDTCTGTSFDTMLAAYTGSAVNALTRQADDDDACGLQSRISFAATSGMTYRIQVDGFGQNRGAFELTWSLPGTQSITFGPLSDVSLGDPPFGVTATASSGLAVSFTSDTTAVCTVAGATVTLLSAGQCTIRAAQTGDGTWAPATDVTQSFQVAAPASAHVSVGDGSVHEGDTKNRSVILPVTLSEPSATTVTVDVVLAGLDATPGTARTPGADFNDKRGNTKTLTFKPGQVVKYVTVPVYPDTVIEGDETFVATLSNPTGGPELGDDLGVGTIVDDDANTSNLISIGDVSIHEGNTTKRGVKFRVTLTEPASTQVTVDYTIIPATATGGYKSGAIPTGTDLRDLLGVTRTLTFKTSTRTGLTGVQKTITVVVFPDFDAEPDETFQVVLSNPTGPAVLSQSNGTAIIRDDD